MLIGAAPPPAATTDVTVTVTGLRSDHGTLRACMTDSPASFPKCRGVAGAHTLIAPASGTVHLDFTDVAPGRYAIALLHDENDNGKADRALMMMPKEGFGFSRDAPVMMGPPKFAAAAFTVQSTPVNQTIRIRYMF